MKRKASIALLLLLTVCGCGSSGSGSEVRHAPAPGAATSTVTAATSGTATTGAKESDDTASDDKNPVDGAQFCAFLTQEEPKLKSAGSQPGAEAEFAIDLASWIDEHPGQKPRTAADLDSASQRSCPKVRTAAVADLGASSFEDSLG
ncbi:hypothetical protein ACFO3J_22945 [Streptomyces polygonati]|uniref:DUF732 domain-containing protein n=1 Tax=Streptomyces polygonati TaxID=1617087 RepID=A0ABV8HQS7_9ACTN